MVEQAEILKQLRKMRRKKKHAPVARLVETPLVQSTPSVDFNVVRQDALGLGRSFHGKRATKVRIEGDNIIVKYHATDVVTVTPHEIILNTGGYFTNTTKQRMNQTSNELGLGYHITQRNYSWYVTYRGKEIGMGTNTVLYRDKENKQPVSKPEKLYTHEYGVDKRDK